MTMSRENRGLILRLKTSPSASRVMRSASTIPSMDFTISPSPDDQIGCTRYDAALFPKFGSVFEQVGDQGAFHLLAQPPEEATRALVMENRGDKDVTALRYFWVMTNRDGTAKNRTVSYDSYLLEEYHPVLQAKQRKLISRLGTVDESLVEHVLAGSGVFVGGVDFRDSIAEVTSLTFTVDMVMFADGEIAGPDSGKFAVELGCRRRAAEFVAKQVRLAEAESRDVAPVLSAITEIPTLRNSSYPQGDFITAWIRRYANEYMRAVRHNNDFLRAATLRRLENHRTLPEYYRSGGRPDQDDEFK
jgi:hypothetical protein